MEEKVGYEKSGTEAVPARAEKRRFEQVQYDVDVSVIKYKRQKSYLSSVYYAHSSPLIYAVKKGFEDWVKELLEYGVGVNAVELDNGNTALHEAARQHESPKICKMLIDAGADVKRRDHSGLLPIHYAVKYHNKNAISTLLAAGSDINSKTTVGNGMFWLCWWGCNDMDWEFVNFLFESGLNFNIQHKDGTNAFYYLNWSDYKNLLPILIDCNPDLNAVSWKYSTPLMYWHGKNEFGENENGKYKNEIEFLIKTMVKMECSSEFKINDVNMVVIETFFLDFYIQCKKEVEDMKLTKVWEGISFFDLLNKPMHKLVYYCKNQELINYLDSGVYKQFKNYSCIIELRMRAAMKKYLLLEKSVEVLEGLVRPINLPYYVCLRILGSLNSYDLKSVSCCELL